MQKGSRLLQVVSIIMLVGCGFTVLVGVLLAAGLSALGGALGGSYGGAAAAMGGVVILILLLFAVGLQLFAAILGVKNWKQPDKATPCIVLGIIMLVFAAIGAMALLSDSQILTALMSLVLPVLYVVGAFQLKKMNTYGAPGAYPPAGYGGYPPAGPEGVPPAGYGAYPPAGPEGYPPPAGYGGYPPAGPEGYSSAGPGAYPPAGPEGAPPADPGAYPPAGPGGYPG